MEIFVNSDVRFQFVRPDWIEDRSYLDKIKDIIDESSVSFCIG